MAISEGKELITQFSYYRQTLHNLKQRYRINKGEFETLCICYDLQQPKQPYFFAPDVVKRLSTVNQSDVYKYIHSLIDKNFVKMSHETKQRSQANYYMVTGQGEAVLRSYIKQINLLINLK